MGAARPCAPCSPPLRAMGTLSCDPAPRLTAVPLGRRATECQIPETGLRKTCRMATLENGTCRPEEGGRGVGPLRGASEEPPPFPNLSFLSSRMSVT